MQHDPGEQRQHQVEVRAEGPGNEQQQKEASQDGGARHVAERFRHQLQRGLRGADRQGTATNRQQGGDHAEVADRVEPEAGGDPEGRDHNPPDGRANDASEIEGRRVEGYRAGQLSAPHHFQHGGLPRRKIQRLVQAEDGGQHQDDRQRDRVGGGEGRVKDRPGERHDLRHKQHVAMGESIHQGAGVEAEDEHRRIAECPKHGQRKGGVVRQLQHQPGRRHRLHPGADDGDRLADVIAAELGILEGRKLQKRGTAWFDGSRRSTNRVQFTGARQTAASAFVSSLNWVVTAACGCWMTIGKRRLLAAENSSRW